VVVGTLVSLTVGISALSAMAAEETTTTTEAPAETTVAAETTTTVAAETETTVAAEATTTVAGEETATTLSAEERQEKARAVANLNLAKAADVEIAGELQSINEVANQTLERIEAATKRIEAAQAITERSQEDLSQSGDRQRQIEASLMLKAVEGFKSRSVSSGGPLLSNSGPNESIRQNQLLNEASSSTAELLEDLRGLLEDRRLATTEAERAESDAKAAEQELQIQFENLKEQQNAQLGLKAEAERRIDQWAGELTAYAREDAAIQQLIGQSAAPVNNAINTPTTPSALGFQWPLPNAQVTSEYGYRVHPVYGTRRLHAGIDIGAPRGEPIASSNDGVVIFVGTQGGYGRTVIVDHGGGITTLYAHMTDWGVVEGQAVSRGDIVGFVGATGTATGNHLHFEVRVNGGPANPRNYMP
jgi:murein DD-endopeptidase MepM/ murein hydrolase activator NlpD